MRIVIDAQLPFATEILGGLGDVVPVPADEIARSVRDADALIVRSVTRVDESLLGGSRVRFVGTATSGTDHVDLRYLQDAGIAFADAAGCNATAVAEYVVAALFHLCSACGIPFDGRSIGVVGCGHVGSRVAEYAAALGMRVVMNDPPLARGACEPVYRPLEEALACDVVTLHVPLERSGSDPTHHLADEVFLAAMKPGAVFINASRGAVVDSSALGRVLQTGHLGACVLDVWEGEPGIDADLVEAVTLATAHIAGHTLDAKRRAVTMMRDALVRRFELDVSPALPGIGATSRVSVDAAQSKYDAIEVAVRASFDIARASEQLRSVVHGDAAARSAGFDALRSGTPVRREFSATELEIDARHPASGVLERLGFRVQALAPCVEGSVP